MHEDNHTSKKLNVTVLHGGKKPSSFKLSQRCPAAADTFFQILSKSIVGMWGPEE